MILEEVENLINETSTIDNIKSSLIGRLGGENSSNIMNHYVRKELKNHNISVTPEEADELIKDRGKTSILFGVPSALMGGILGSLAGPQGAMIGAGIGGGLGALAGRTIENDKFIKNKIKKQK
jgi:hypothetical protein